jgi:hypothetical protein
MILIVRNAADHTSSEGRSFSFHDLKKEEKEKQSLKEVKKLKKSYFEKVKKLDLKVLLYFVLQDDLRNLLKGRKNKRENVETKRERENKREGKETSRNSDSHKLENDGKQEGDNLT